MNLIEKHPRKYLPTAFDADLFIQHTANKLREILPFDQTLVQLKSSQAKELAPVDENFQMIRAASMLRKMYRLREPIGVSRMSVLYRAKKRRGSKPAQTVRAARGILRKLMQRLEQVGLLVQSADPLHRGRLLSPKGQSFLDSCVKDLIPTLHERTE